MNKEKHPVPTQTEIMAAAGKTVPDIIAHGLKVLFCGINPGLYTAAIGHHFGRPGNRFWPALYKSGFTDRLLSPYEEQELLKYGYGITNIVEHATASAGELMVQQYKEGSKRLISKLMYYKPKILAVLGIGAYRITFNKKEVKIGRQDEKVLDTVLWVLPNPSGLNAHYDLEEIAKLFHDLKVETERMGLE